MKRATMGRTRTVIDMKQILGAGVICGMRTLSGPAFLAAYAQKHERQIPDGSLLRWLATPPVPFLLKAMAAGELAGDKLPGIPARIETGALLARLLSGALVGAGLSTLQKRSRLGGALLGGAAAVGAAYAAYHARRALTEGKGLPDPLVALAEDAVVMGLGFDIFEVE